MVGEDFEAVALLATSWYKPANCAMANVRAREMLGSMRNMRHRDTLL